MQRTVGITQIFLAILSGFVISLAYVAYAQSLSYAEGYKIKKKSFGIVTCFILTTDGDDPRGISCL